MPSPLCLMQCRGFAGKNIKARMHYHCHCSTSTDPPQPSCWRVCHAELAGRCCCPLLMCSSMRRHPSRATSAIQSCHHYGCRRGMAPTVQPPSPANSKGTPLGTTASLVDTAHQLRDLISKIALPKTRTAKTVTISIEDLHLMQRLSAAACMSEHHKGPQLSDISRQLDDIKAQLDTPNAYSTTPCLPLSQKHSCTATPVTGVRIGSPDAGPHPPRPHPSKWYSITLTQKSRDKASFCRHI